VLILDLSKFAAINYIGIFNVVLSTQKAPGTAFDPADM
jgi:hypothetical protein